MKKAWARPSLQSLSVSQTATGPLYFRTENNLFNQAPIGPQDSTGRCNFGGGPAPCPPGP